MSQYLFLLLFLACPLLMMFMMRSHGHGHGQGDGGHAGHPGCGHGGHSGQSDDRTSVDDLRRRRDELDRQIAEGEWQGEPSGDRSAERV
jgi:hypothetical protein